MTRCAVSAFLLLFVATGLAGAAEPRSAIPWLSDLATAPAPPVETEDPEPRAADAPIEVAGVDAVKADAAGLASAESLDLPRDLWRGVSALRARSLIEKAPIGGVRAARRLLHAIMTARLQAPSGSGEAASLVLARAEKLLALADPAQADALIRAANLSTVAAADIRMRAALLIGDVDGVCGEIDGGGLPSPGAAERVYCFAATGATPAAALTLAAARDIDDMPVLDQALLEALVNGPGAAGVSPPRQAADMTPLRAALIDDLALTGPSPRSLPLAYRVRDLAKGAPRRSRIAATERLVEAGVLLPETLVALYRDQRSAESGGVWGRVESYQKAAKASQKPAAIAAFLDRGREAGLPIATAHVAAPLIAKPNAGDTLPSGFLRTLLLAEKTDAAASLTPTEPLDAALTALATGTPEPQLVFAKAGEVKTVRLSAALAALNDGAAPEGFADSATLARITEQVEAGRPAAAIFKSLALLSAGPQIAPGAFYAALVGLRDAGLEVWARRIAVEILILGE